MTKVTDEALQGRSLSALGDRPLGLDTPEPPAILA